MKVTSRKTREKCRRRKGTRGGKRRSAEDLEGGRHQEGRRREGRELR